ACPLLCSGRRWSRPDQLIEVWQAWILGGSLSAKPPAGEAITFSHHVLLSPCERLRATDTPPDHPTGVTKGEPPTEEYSARMVTRGHPQREEGHGHLPHGRPEGTTLPAAPRQGQAPP